MIILASQSSLRTKIMELSGIPFRTESPDVDERSIEAKYPQKNEMEIVTLLAAAKAEAVSKIFPNDIIIAADTFGTLPNGQRLHKAGSFEESIQLSLQQSGKTVTVNTGTAVALNGKILTDTTTTMITYSHFNENTARALFELNKNTNRRNAALGFFIDAPGFTLVESISGSYMGALGLPLDVVRKRLNEFGYEPTHGY